MGGFPDPRHLFGRKLGRNDVDLLVNGPIGFRAQRASIEESVEVELAHRPREEDMLLVGIVGPDGEEKMQVEAERADGGTGAGVAQLVVDRDAVEEKRDGAIGDRIL